jgi:MFS family permease
MLFVSGLGGLLYGIDIGVIDPALTYLNRSVSLSAPELSAVVAAVLAGSIAGSVVAGMLADWLGRRPMMIASALLFLGSVGLILASRSFLPLLAGRALQGLSGGVIAVVVPLYLAECLPAQVRGRGTALFQFMLTVGIVLAAFVGAYYTGTAEQAIAQAGADQGAVIAAADHAWRGMFLAVCYPGALFLAGTLLLAESPRWLLRKGRPEQAQAALARLRPAGDCSEELAAMRTALEQEQSAVRTGWVATWREILGQRRYVVPFVLACVILACNQATGINSILQFMTTILQQAGLDPLAAASSGTLVKIVNAVMTVVAIWLVERKGRVFLLKLGTGGIVLSLCILAWLFHETEAQRTDVTAPMAAVVRTGASAASASDLGLDAGAPQQVTIVYAQDGQQRLVRWSVSGATSAPLPWTAPPAIVRALAEPVPSQTHGLMAALCLALFMASFAIGPGVCVWLALSELMPTRIRSVGMGLALLLNQGVATAIAAVFLPLTAHYGFHAMFLVWAGCTAVYFFVVARYLPETQGKSLEQIEGLFAR